ncbi:UV excision repair protein rad23 [Coemansia interrupta]|uniref:UV excision repair protein RAD23 n=1 Tax=Coemansia interrupta TaxID=1126814 RepID=A0A9W8H6A9_9FUNG|nr:UV excision repair protein rad23 [Coemansia interrupta]
MQISLKTLQQKTFQIDVSATDTIGQVKQKVEESQGYPADTQKLIFSGKILTNEQTIEEIKITEKDFMVVMTTKAKPAAKQEVSTPAGAGKAEAPVGAPAVQRMAARAIGGEEDGPPTPSPVRTAAPAAATAAPEAAEAAAGGDGAGVGHSFIGGEQYETAIGNMVEMGYTREQCVRAMRASFNNPDRAVEYLIMGIPEAALRMADEAEARSAAGAASAEQPSAQQQQPQQQQRPAGGSGNLFDQAASQMQQQQQRPAVATGNDMQMLSALRATPQFRQLQQLLRDDPQMLTQVMMELAQQQPQLMEVISRNNEEFMMMLLEGFSEEQMARILQHAGGSEYEDGEDEGQPRRELAVTAEEMAAIDRLVELGFSRDVVIQAYFACDKNEELTANHLLEHGSDYM